MDPLVLILLCLTASYLLSEFFEGMQLPRVLGSITVGVILGIPIIFIYLFDQTTLELFKSFKDLGLIFLMFYVGLKMDITDLRKGPHNAKSVAIFSALIPFLMGFFLMIILNWIGIVQLASPIITGIIVGGILSVTAETSSMDILAQFKVLKTKLAKTIIAADIFDNIIEALLIAFIVTFVHYIKSPVQGILMVIFDIVVFFILVYIAGYLIIPFIMRFISTTKPKIDLFIISLILALFMAVASEYLGIGSVLGALLAGMIMRYATVKGRNIYTEHKITEIIEVITFGLMAPFFFIWIGMHSNFSFIILNPWLAITITIVAFSGKVIGSVFGNWLAGGKRIEGLTLGWAMSARGAVELVAAEIARINNLISSELFSALVFMAFITTIISPLVFKFYLTKYYSRSWKSSKS